MEKTTTDSKGRVVPTEEFKEHVQNLISDVEEPGKNDGLVAYVYHQTDLNTDEAARLLGTANVTLTQHSMAMRYRSYFQDVDVTTECDDPLDDRDLLRRLLVEEGLCERAVEAVLRTGYLETKEALREHGLNGCARTHRNGEAFRVENLPENQ